MTTTDSSSMIPFIVDNILLDETGEKFKLVSGDVEYPRFGLPNFEYQLGIQRDQGTIDELKRFFDDVETEAYIDGIHDSTPVDVPRIIEPLESGPSLFYDAQNNQWTDTGTEHPVTAFAEPISVGEGEYTPAEVLGDYVDPEVQAFLNSGEVSSSGTDVIYTAPAEYIIDINDSSEGPSAIGEVIHEDNVYTSLDPGAISEAEVLEILDEAHTILEDSVSEAVKLLEEIDPSAENFHETINAAQSTYERATELVDALSDHGYDTEALEQRLIQPLEIEFEELGVETVRDPSLLESLGGAVSELGENATLQRAFKVGGKLVVFAAVAGSVAKVVTAEDKVEEALKQAGGWAGGAVAALAVEGLIIGSGPIGWAAGAIFGAAVGAAGFYAGETLADTAYHFFSGDHEQEAPVDPVTLSDYQVVGDIGVSDGMEVNNGMKWSPIHFDIYQGLDLSKGAT